MTTTGAQAQGPRETEELVRGLRRMTMALRLELAEAVANDVAARVEVAVVAIRMIDELTGALHEILAQQGLLCTPECLASQRMVEIASRALSRYRAALAVPTPLDPVEVERAAKNLRAWQAANVDGVMPLDEDEV